MGAGTSVDPGLRDRLVTIQSVADADGSSGFPIETVTELAQVYMTKRDLSGKERFTMGQLSAVVDSVFEMPYHADLDPETADLAKTRRLVYGGRTYDIVRAEMRGRRDGVLLFCLAKAG